MKARSLSTATKVGVHSRRLVHHNRWFEHCVDDVTLPDGRRIPEHHVIHFHHASVGIVAVNDQDQILLVNIWRHPLGRYGWEIPAGGMEEGEEPIEAAARELLEETGYGSTDRRLTNSFNPMNSMTDLLFHIVTCKVEGEPSSDTDGEVTELRWMTWDAVREMIGKGEISDGLTLTGLLLTKAAPCLPALPVLD